MPNPTPAQLAAERVTDFTAQAKQRAAEIVTVEQQPPDRHFVRVSGLRLPYRWSSYGEAAAHADCLRALYTAILTDAIALLPAPRGQGEREHGDERPGQLSGEFGEFSDAEIDEIMDALSAAREGARQGWPLAVKRDVARRMVRRWLAGEPTLHSEDVPLATAKAAEIRARRTPPPDERQRAPETRPRIVCLCGSTRFKDAFTEANKRETLAGRIVLTVGCFGHVDTPLTEEQKTALDVLHKRKIDLADEVLVINVGGYVGASTRSEVEYAAKHGKGLRWLEPDHALPYADLAAGCARWPVLASAPALARAETKPWLTEWREIGPSGAQFRSVVGVEDVDDYVMRAHEDGEWCVYSPTGDVLAAGVAHDLASAKHAADEAARQWYTLPDAPTEKPVASAWIDDGPGRCRMVDGFAYTALKATPGTFSVWGSGSERIHRQENAAWSQAQTEAAADAYARAHAADLPWTLPTAPDVDLDARDFHETPPDLEAMAHGMLATKPAESVDHLLDAEPEPAPVHYIVQTAGGPSVNGIRHTAACGATVEVPALEDSEAAGFTGFPSHVRGCDPCLIASGQPEKPQPGTCRARIFEHAAKIGHYLDVTANRGQPRSSRDSAIHSMCHHAREILRECNALPVASRPTAPTATAPEPATGAPQPGRDAQGGDVLMVDTGVADVLAWLDGLPDTPEREKAHDLIARLAKEHEALVAIGFGGMDGAGDVVEGAQRIVRELHEEKRQSRETLAEEVKALRVHVAERDALTAKLTASEQERERAQAELDFERLNMAPVLGTALRLLEYTEEAAAATTTAKVMGDVVAALAKSRKALAAAEQARALSDIAARQARELLASCETALEERDRQLTETRAELDRVRAALNEEQRAHVGTQRERDRVRRQGESDGITRALDLIQTAAHAPAGAPEPPTFLDDLPGRPANPAGVFLAHAEDVAAAATAKERERALGIVREAVDGAEPDAKVMCRYLLHMIMRPDDVAATPTEPTPAAGEDRDR